MIGSMQLECVKIFMLNSKLHCGSDEDVAMGVGAGADGVGRVGGCEA